jgi:predicted transcriptional regulator
MPWLKKMTAKHIKERTIVIEEREGAFTTIFNRFRSEKKHEQSEIGVLRSILTTEKSRLLHMLKTKQPNSIYELAKLLGRDFKSVRQDITLLEKLGFIEMIPIYKGKREKLKPILVVDVLKIRIEL